MLKNRLITCCIACCIGAPFNAQAANLQPPPDIKFDFNFLPLVDRNKVGVFAACGIGNLPIGMGAKGNQMCDDDMKGPGTYAKRFVHDGYIPDNTEYLQEHDSINDIFHQVMIDYAQNWKMEVYMATPKGTADITNARPTSSGKNDNHVFPLDSKNQYITGTGTGDAKRVQWRMVVEGTGFNMDMIKNGWDKKPKITQVITDKDMSSTLTIDMSNSSYSQMFIPAVVTHTTTVKGLTPFDFDSRTSDSATITGGRFMITGYLEDTKNPSYDYIGAPDDFGKNMNWLEFWHGSQNPAYWQPGEPYGYGDTTNYTEGSTGGFGP